MGTPLIENPEGNPAGGCFLDGGAFGLGTPHIVTVHLTGWSPAGRFEESDRLELSTPKQLYQTTNPMHWHAVSDKWHWHLQWLAGRTLFWLNRIDPQVVYAFRSLMNGGCRLVVENQLFSFPVVVTLGGVATMTFSQEFTE